MPSRPPSRDDRSRAEARRRARLAAQGVRVETARTPEPVPERPAGGGGFLSKLFPAAPPLPGREQPLAGFSYAGAPAFRGVAETVWLLARNPLAWIGTGAVWAVSRILTDNSWFGIFMSVVSFGSLIAAGWLGWRRPWLYGAAAALLGWIAVLLVILTLFLTNPGAVDALLGAAGSPSPTAAPSASAAASPAAEASPAASVAPSPGASPDAEANGALEATPLSVGINIGLQTIFQLLLGVAAGWYGGYLRRRTAVTSTTQRRSR